MMDVVVADGARARVLLWQPRRDAWALTVVCKITFDLAPGVSQISAAPEEVHDEDTHWDDDPSPDLHVASDLLPFKARPEVLVIGHAHAPPDARSGPFFARLRVGSVDKSMPIAADRRLLSGLGPLPPSAPSRASRLPDPSRGAPDLRAGPLPEGLSPAYFNVAPEDQWLERLLPDQAIELWNLHRMYSHLSTTLSPVLPCVRVVRRGEAPSQVKLTPDTLWIDADRASAALVYRGQKWLEARGSDPSRVIASVARVEVDIERQRDSGPSSSTPGDVEATVAPSRVLSVTLPFHARTQGGVSIAERQPHTRQPLQEAIQTLRATPLPRLAAVDETCSLDPEPPPPLAPLPAPPLAPFPAQQGTIGQVMLSGAAGPAHVSPSTSGLPLPLPEEPIESWEAGSFDDPSPTPERPASERAASLNRTRAVVSSAVIEPIFVEAASVEKIDASPDWAPIVEAARSDANQGRARADLQKAAAILACGSPDPTGRLEPILSAVPGPHGQFTPPLVLVEGDLEVSFDEAERLKAIVLVLSPLVPPDDRALREALSIAAQAIAAPWIEGAGGVASRLVSQIRDVYGRGQRGVPFHAVETQVERVLLEGRHYQKRALLGQSVLRASIAAPSGPPVPAYLPASLARELPLFVRVPVRAIAELRPRVDQYEEQPLSLRIVALGRVLSRS